MKLKSKDLILHLLNVHGLHHYEPIIGITRFQKIVFLFEKEIWKDFKFDKLILEDQLPQFEPYNFGPFSEKLTQDIEFLCNLGFIDTNKIDATQLNREDMRSYALILNNSTSIDHDQLTTIYKISDKGKRFVSTGRAGVLSENQIKALTDFKIKCNSVPLSSLLYYVYTKYPDMTINSQIKKSVLGNHV